MKLKDFSLTIFALLVVMYASLDVAAAQTTMKAQSLQVADARQDAAKQIFKEALKLLRANDLEGAFWKFELGFGIYPDNAAAHYYMAKTMQGLGREEEAMSHFKRAAELGPNTKEGIIADAILKREATDRARPIISSKVKGNLTVVSWGGAYTHSQVEAFHKPYMNNSRVRITSHDSYGGLAEVRAQVDSENVTWDVVDLDIGDAIKGCREGLLERIDPKILTAAPDGTPAKQDFINGTITECAVGNIVWSTVYAYNKQKFGTDVPSTIGDFFDIAKYPGKRGLRDEAKVNLEWALMADGVKKENVYKVLGSKSGLNRAFAKLDTIKDHIVWWNRDNQPAGQLANGHVVMSSGYNNRFYDAIENEQLPLGIVWDGQIWEYDVWAIPKGARNVDAALDFIKFSTSTKPMTEQANYVAYGPVRKSSNYLIPGNRRRYMPTVRENFGNALNNNARWWEEHHEKIDARFRAWLTEIYRQHK